ncbi:hypothetical protein HAX54_009478 [Datura stramonium]|uniref:Uncharacterized protein n=1 Tax=Datura stramonium TaxID=4076 RepID=A0ABS8TEW5_DATST|nr:hypothetical protein [Datura stramonium]
MSSIEILTKEKTQDNVRDESFGPRFTQGSKQVTLKASEKTAYAIYKTSHAPPSIRLYNMIRTPVAKKFLYDPKTTPRWLATNEAKDRPSFEKMTRHSKDGLKARKFQESRDRGKNGLPF